MPFKGSKIARYQEYFYQSPIYYSKLLLQVSDITDERFKGMLLFQSVQCALFVKRLSRNTPKLGTVRKLLHIFSFFFFLFILFFHFFFFFSFFGVASEHLLKLFSRTGIIHTEQKSRVTTNISPTSQMDDFRTLNNALCAGCNNEVGVRPDHFEMGHDSKMG